MRLLKLLLTFVMLGNLTLLFAAQTTLSDRTERSRDISLANTQWRLASFGTQDTESSVVEGTSVTLKFGSDGRASGSGGCNSYGGQYREEGDSVSFNQVISTKRACLESKRNQQEQRYFAALESAKTFKLSDDRLTIFYGDGQSTLNFVNDAPATTQEQRCENVTSPVDVLTAFYNAVNSKDYRRAYGYWETPPSNFEEFVRGYAQTANVQVIVQLSIHVEGAAGSVYADIPTALTARQRDGSERTFVGCYVTRKSNLSPADVPKEELWHIYRAKMTPVTSKAAIPKLLAEACKDQ